MDPPIKLDDRYYHECSSIFTEYRLMREFVLFQEQNITNVYIVPSQSSAFVWFGVIFVHDQPYQGAILRFRIVIPPDYPCHETPKVIFDRKPFHPLINPSNGQVCTLKHFESWDPNINHVWQVIKLVKGMFMNLEEEIDQLAKICSIVDEDGKVASQEGGTIDDRNSGKTFKQAISDPLIQSGQNRSGRNLSNHLTEQIMSQINVEAIKLYHEDFDTFQFKVAEVVVESRSKLYDEPEEEGQIDDHHISFAPFNPQVHEDIRKNVLLAGKTTIDTNGQNQAIFYVKGNPDVEIN